MNRIIDLSKLSKVMVKIRKSEKNIVLVGGCFDILHLGHIIFLEKAKKKGNFLIVLLESDQNVKEKKGENRPLNSQKNRAKVLAAVYFVDLIILLPKMKNADYDRVVNLIKPKIIAVTWGDPEIKHKKRVARLISAKLSQVTEFITDHSTTKFLERIV